MTAGGQGIPGEDFLWEVIGRSDAFTMGWHAGYDAGVAAAEQEMAEAHAVEVKKIRALGKPDDWMARVRAAELHSRRLAERQWRNLDAWKSVAAQSVTDGARRAGIPAMSAADLARACGVRL